MFQSALREYMGPFGSKPQGNKLETWRITGLSVSASKIVDIPSGTSSIMRYFQSQSTVPSCSADGSVRDHVAMTPSASEGCSEQRSTETQAAMSEENTGVTYTLPHIKDPDKEINLFSEKDAISCPSSEATDVRTQLESNKNTQTKRIGLKINNSKEKNRGMPSIVDIFKNYNATPPLKLETQEDSTTGKRASFSSEVNEEVEEERRETEWSYKTDEIDQSVFDELPVEIQRELRSLLRPNKRFNAGKNKSDGSTSSIAHYFPPLKR